MNTRETHHVNTERMPLPTVRKKKGFSLVWVIPIVAILIAASLVYKAITEKGPVVTISFESADGLVVGKTKIKYKDVEIGQIEAITVSENLKGVIATVHMDKKTSSWLTDKTRFWVVRPRLSGGNVSGLGTLLSGSHIAIDPSLEGAPQDAFVGLEIPPVIMSDQPGRQFNLSAPKLGSIERGSPVYFKGIKVGQVMGYELMDSGKSIDIQVFIEAPYDEKVISSTRFWFSSGLDMNLSANGMRIDTESFISIMIGGLVFSNPDQIKQGEPVTPETVLPVYDSYDHAIEIEYAEKEYFVLKFTDSVRGLVAGAPVEFRGFRIGNVIDIGLEMNWQKQTIKIPVKIEVEPDRIFKLMQNPDSPENNIQEMIDMGMRAQLQTGNLITGNLFVALDIFEDAAPASMVVHDDIIELPTIPSPLNELTTSLTSLLKKLKKLPLDEIGDVTLNTIQGINDTTNSFKGVADNVAQIISSNETKQVMDSLNQSMASIQNLTAQLEQKLPSSVDKVSKETINTLTGIQKIAASDSTLVFELKQTLREFSKTAQSIRSLADLLERHPESILQGK